MDYLIDEGITKEKLDKVYSPIGGGSVEAELRQKAFNCIDNQQCKLVKIDMTGREAEVEGMVFGGIVEIFVESII